MKNNLIPSNEKERMDALRKYNILDTPADGAFDHITSLAATIFDVPIAIISLVDSDRIWFKSAHGLSVNQIDREPGLCASAILSDDIYVINNARTDPRSLANPLVVGEFGLQFYAAAPLQTQDHYNLGTLCILDKSPKKLTDKEQKTLRQLGVVVMDTMEQRLNLRDAAMNLRKLASDLGYQLDKTMEVLDQPNEPDKEKAMEYLDASRAYVRNMESQLTLL